MDRVVIGMDPHKASVTIEARDGGEVLRARGRFGTDEAGYRRLLEVGRAWPQRVWAVEGAHGIGRAIAARLLADGERVLDVPARLAARVRIFDTGQGRKTDAADAHAIVLVALRNQGLREVVADPQLEVLGLLCDRRDELSRARVQALGRLHRLFLQLLPGGAPTRKSTARYAALLGGVRAVDPVGRTLRRMAAAEVADLERVEAELKALTGELRAAVLARGSHLMDLHGIGPAGAARILADVGEVARFPDRHHFASWTGTAPIDASSGEHTRHRLSRAGNRRLNHVLHIAAVVQIRNDTAGRAYYRRKRAAGKGGLEAIRCLKRRLSDAVYRQLTTDADANCAGQENAGPGGHSGASVPSSAADLTPRVGTSDQPQPGPAPTTLPTPQTAEKTTPAPDSRDRRRRAGGVNVQRPTGRTTLTPTSIDAHSTAPGAAP